MKRYTGCIIIILLTFILGPKVGYTAPIEFWTTETQSDRTKTIQLLIDTFEALNSDINNSEEYLQNIKNASESVATLSEIYNQTSEAIKVDSNTYNEQLQKVSNNLSALNAVYELQLQSTNEQLEASNRMQEGINQFMANINDSVENTNMYKEQLEALTQNIAALNNVYGNMLSAMNVGVNR